ncbi:hypothetical protein BAUCODRAFT_163951 [Baudoinia panamericana UAMH 10762]|uniref:SET domain-containing protein n=1 Tax=Baudoinia panamericana (strain UAMH 10762) TaxID=717646 RepID=M2M099_BAUPA|nr:uncharacterized protein BAUCODRAFT_163951 [Baudoinia panamericana UAMH 10762]EMD00423.1 hypothetical protein BAUCODRAFT_163951 [Baudoinia panamericana UAMH 10762]
MSRYAKIMSSPKLVCSRQYFANHSCRPNAVVSWNPNTAQGTLHALTVIMASSIDIEIDYLGGEQATLQSGAGRRRLLQRDYGFRCECPACGNPGRRNIEDDNRRMQAGDLFRSIYSHPETTPALTAVNAAFERTRTTQIEQLSRYITLLPQLKLVDTKLARAYEARAKLP